MEDYENEEAEDSAQGLQMPPQTHPMEPRIQPLKFSFSEEDLASDDEGSEYEEPLAGYALDGRFEAPAGSDDLDSDGDDTDIASKIRKLQRKLEGGSSDSETDSGSGLTAHEGNEDSWSPEIPETAHSYQMRSIVPDSGAWKDGISAEGSGKEDSGSDEAPKEGGSARSLWQGLGGDLAEREQRRKEMMQFLDTVLHSSNADGEKVVQIPSNFQALVDGLAGQRRSETPLAWADAHVIGTSEGLRWAPSESGLVSKDGDSSISLSGTSLSGTRPRSVDSKLQKGFERIEQLDRMLEEKQALAEETARKVYPERFSAEEQKARFMVQFRMAKRRRRRQARLKRAMIATGLGSKRVSAGDYVGRNMVMGPNARYFTLLPEEEALVNEMLAQMEVEMGDEDASYTSYASTGFDVDGDEAMQLAAINARLDSLRGHPGYFDTDSFSSANGSSIFDYAGAGSMSRALPQEMGPGGRSDSISSAPSEGAKKTPNPTPRGETNTRPSTQRSDLESQSSKASKPLSSQKRRASSSGPGTKFRRSNEGDGDSQADVFDPKGEGLPSEGRREAFQQFKARESARKSGPVNESNRSEYLREDARKTGPVDDYLREQRERREAAAKQEEIDKKIRALRTAEVPAVLGADELADLLAQCRQEQEALKQREEMMRRISTPGFEGSAPSVDGSRQKGRSSNGGSSKSSRKSSATNGKVGSGGKEVGSEAGARNPGRKSEQASDVGEFKAEPIGDGLTEERLVTRNKPTSSITELPPAKGAGAAYDMSKGEKRPKSADALFTLPAL